MNAVGVCILISLMVIVLFMRRKWATIGMMASVLYLTQGQAIDLFGLNLTAVRLLEVAGFGRVIVRRELSFSKLNSIDHALMVFYGFTTLVFLLRSTEGQAFQIGLAVDAILCYFTFRGLIWDAAEFRWFLCTFLYILAPYTLLVIIERLTGHNAFAFMGGIIESALYRNDRPRCWGSFRHPVLLGTFGASFLPLYIGLHLSKVNRIVAFAGIAFCFMIIWASNSGGPLSAVTACVIGWLLWFARSNMQFVRWGFAGLIVLLSIVMKAPIWYILAKVSSITGGAGWHRAYLLDTAFKNIDQWWFAGMPITETHDWFPYGSMQSGGADITNQYIEFGLAAGLGSIALFVILLLKAFSALGRALSIARRHSHRLKGTEFMLWGLGVTLSVHLVSWLGVSYFDQMYVVWFMHLAVISTLSHAPVSLL